jgi:hypothetical protein
VTCFKLQEIQKISAELVISEGRICQTSDTCQLPQPKLWMRMLMLKYVSIFLARRLHLDNKCITDPFIPAYLERCSLSSQAALWFKLEVIIPKELTFRLWTEFRIKKEYHSLASLANKSHVSFHDTFQSESSLTLRTNS